MHGSYFVSTSEVTGALPKVSRRGRNIKIDGRGGFSLKSHRVQQESSSLEIFISSLLIQQFPRSYGALRNHPYNNKYAARPCHEGHCGGQHHGLKSRSRRISSSARPTRRPNSWPNSPMGKDPRARDALRFYSPKAPPSRTS